MDTLNTTMARQVAEAASAFQKKLAGHTPESVTVVLDDDMLVITLHGSLSPAEIALSRNAAGTAQVQEFHRQLFASSSDALRQEITRITGLKVRETAAEVEPATGNVVHAFTTGTTVQVFQLVKRSPLDIPGNVASIAHINRVNHEHGEFSGQTPCKTNEDSLPTATHP